MGPNPVWLASLQEEEIWTKTQREEHVRTQGEEGHLQAKERSLWRNQSCSDLDLGLPVPRKYIFWCLSDPIPKELMLSNCGAGEGSWETLKLQGDQTSQS